MFEENEETCTNCGWYPLELIEYCGNCHNDNEEGCDCDPHAAFEREYTYLQSECCGMKEHVE